MNIREEILRLSYKNGLTHIASALSQADYIDELFTKNLVVPYRDKIVLGKVFGSQAYLLVWKKLGYINNTDGIGFIKHTDMPFVDFGEHTLGNGLGVAAGIAMACPDKMVWVNISDGALQMGNTLEAIQFIGHNKLKNIMLTVDYNGGQVTGKVDDILTVEPVIGFFKEYGWGVYDSDLTEFGVTDKPKVFIMRNAKGKGVKSIEENIRLWHYKKIDSYEELQSLVQELQGT
jgi:transketolase